MGGSVGSLLLLLLTAVATANALCTNSTNLASLQYSVSPNFAWLPSDTEPNDILDQVRKANPTLFHTVHTSTPGIGGGRRPSLPLMPPPGNSGSAGISTIRASIPRFLNSPCTFNLAVTTGPTIPPQSIMRMLNETLASSDLLCKLALHKTGDVRTEYAHTMLTMHLKGVISPKGASGKEHYFVERQVSGTSSTTTDKPRDTSVPANGAAPPASQIDAPPQWPNAAPAKSPAQSGVVIPPAPGSYRGSKQTESGSIPRAKGFAIQPGFEYTVSCPPSLGKPKDGEAAATVIEGLKDVALVRDCAWCKKAVGELQNVCRTYGADIALDESGWIFGSAICEGCPP
jgi:hypothetical protein